jgi:hypothetical protein
VAGCTAIILALLAIGAPTSHAITNGQGAGIVIGQSGYTASTAGSGPNGLDAPSDAIFDSHGDLWVVDQSNCRILEFVPPFTNGMSASLVIGQPNLSTATCAPDTTSGSPTSSVDSPQGIAFDASGDLWVTDLSNNRILEFVPPFTSGMSASLEIGQSSCAYNTDAAPSPPTASSLNRPHWLAFDSSGNLWVSDYTNNRVLEYAYPFSCSESASRVIGQAGFVTNTRPSTFDNPSGLAFDSSGDLWVADQNDGVVDEFQFATSGTATGAQTSSTLQDTTMTWMAGQWDNFVVTITSGTGAGQFRTISSNTANKLTVSSAWTTTPDSTSQYSIGSPPNGQNFAIQLGNVYTATGIGFDSAGDLWVANFGNNRVVEFTAPFSNGESFTTVVGQSSPTGTACATTRTGDCYADSVAFDSAGDLWIAEYGNNRVVEYGQVSPATTTAAVNCSPSTTVDVGSSATCTTTVTGQTGSITGETMTWSQTGGTGSVSFSTSACSLSGSPESCSVTVTGFTAGSSTIQASYPGDVINLASSNTTALTVNSALVVGAVSGAPSTIDQGQTSSLSTTFSGGTSPYTCQWLMEAPGAGSFSNFGSSSSCTSPASAPFATTGSTTAGTWKFELQVTDGASNAVTSSAGSVAVDSALSAGAITPSSPSVDYGQSVTLTANPLGGTAPYFYQWYAGASCTSPISGATSSTYDTGTLTSSVSYYYKVTDSAQSPSSACSPGDAVMVFVPIPDTTGGVLLAPGTAFTDSYGNTWVAPGGSLITYFFVDPPTSFPLAMYEGWGGVYGTCDGQDGWIVTYY